MKIIDGNYTGNSAKVYSSAFGSDILEVSTGMLKSAKYKIPKEIQKIKLLNKDTTWSAGRCIILLIVTFILTVAAGFIDPTLGLLVFIVGILASMFSRATTFTIALQTTDGNRFVFSGAQKEWAMLKKYIGIGSLDDPPHLAAQD